MAQFRFNSLKSMNLSRDLVISVAGLGQFGGNVFVTRRNQPQALQPFLVQQLGILNGSSDLGQPPQRHVSHERNLKFTTIVEHESQFGHTVRMRRSVKI